jgi:transposase
MTGSLALGSIEVLGPARRRRWPDEVKLAILSEVNTNGWTLSDVARRHDVTRQHLYQWRRELRAKGRLDVERRDPFVPVERFGLSEPVLPATHSGAAEISVHLRSGHQLRCRETVPDDVLARLVRVLDAV